MFVPRAATDLLPPPQISGERLGASRRGGTAGRQTEGSCTSTDSRTTGLSTTAISLYVQLKRTKYASCHEFGV